jgi:hypothetical protein
MNKLLSIPSVIALTGFLMTACGGTDDIKSGEAFIRALPDEQTLTVSAPDQKTQALSVAEQGVARDQQALIVGTWSDLALKSMAAAWVINFNAWKLLATIRFVTLMPPTIAVVENGTMGDGDKTFNYNARAVWGPYQDKEKSLEFIMQVWRGIDQKENRNAFIYVVQGRPVGADDSAWKILITGAAEPFEESLGKGLGVVKVDFNTIKALDPTAVNVGQVSFYYERKKGDHRAVAAVATGVWSDEQHTTTTDATYLYGVSAKGYALLNFSTEKDIITTTSNNEQLQVATAWLANGDGRSDVTITGGDLVNGTDHLSECWGIDLKTTYYRLQGVDQVGDSINIVSGSESDCFTSEPIPIVDIDYDAIKNALE